MTLLPSSALKIGLTLATFIGLWLFLLIVYRLVLRQLPRLIARLHPSLDRHHLVDRLVETVRPIVFFVIALYVAVQRLGLGPRQHKVADATLTLVVAWQLLLLVNRLIEFSLTHMRTHEGRNGATEKAKSNLVALAKIAVWTGAILFLLDNFGFNVSTFVAGLGVGGIAVALAAQAILGDTFGSFTISLDKPFDVGDFISAGDMQGTVEDVGLKTTRIRSLSGELWVVPNSELTKARLRNYAKMVERRSVLRVAVVPDTPVEDLERVPALIKKAVEATADTRFDRAHLAGFIDKAIDFEAVWYVTSPNYALYMDRQQSIHLDLLRLCRDAGIHLAFPPR